MYRILIVEDDPVIAGQVGGYLTKWGYEVKGVSDFGRPCRFYCDEEGRRLSAESSGCLMAAGTEER